jgi:hypothetical protein
MDIGRGVHVRLELARAGPILQVPIDFAQGGFARRVRAAALVGCGLRDVEVRSPWAG